MNPAVELSVLIISDRKGKLRLLKTRLKSSRDWFLRIYQSPQGELALQKLKESFHDLIFLDCPAEARSTFNLLDKIRQHYPKSAVIILSAVGNRKLAVAAIKRGAADFMTYAEFKKADLAPLFRRVMEIRYLADQNMELRQLNQMKNEFIANVSHELRTPLSVILGYAETLKATTLGPLTEHQTKALESIIYRASDLLRTLNQILSIREGSEQRQPLLLKPVELKGLLTRWAAKPGHEVARKNIKIKVELPKEAVWVQADLEKLEQVIDNLLMNAGKFGPVNSSVRLSLQIQPDKAVVSVEDQGPGVAQEMLPRLFEEFSAASQGMTREHSGLGLGLPLSKQIIERHSGRIWLESSAKQPGCTAIFTLPLMPDHKQKRILLVEDNPDLLDLMTLFLSGMRQGYHVLTAKSGLEALESVRAKIPDLIIMDVMMPGMSGLEVIGRLAKSPATRNIPIMVLTGYEEAVQKARLAGARDVLVKPFKRETLFAKITGLLKD